jgi:cell division protein FtsL
MINRPLLYAMAISVPAMLGLQVWQTSRYTHVEAELRALEKSQGEWIESNKRLIAGMAVLGSTERIERIARDDLSMEKIAPEAVLQVRISPAGGIDG